MKEKNRISTIIITSIISIIGILGSAWWLSDSVVIQAELYDSIVDLVYSVMIVSGFLLSRRERKPKYPEGLIRLEPILASVVGVIVVGTGGYIIYNSILRIGSENTTEFSWIALCLIILSTFIKFLLFYYVRKKSRKLDSSSLYATSADLKTDLFTHVASIIGFLSVLTSYQSVEPIVATCIAGYILFTGFNVIKNNIPNILGFSIDEEHREDLKDAALSHDKVHGLHDFEVHFTGDLIDMSMHLEIKSDISVSEGHEIETSVASTLREESNHKVNEINIHLDPDELDEWKSPDETSS